MLHNERCWGRSVRNTMMVQTWPLPQESFRRKAKLFSEAVWLFATPGTVAHQASLSMGILQAGIVAWVAMPSSRVSSQPRDWTQVSHIAGRFFTIWATREAQNIGVGSLSLLQDIFPTKESNQGLLHCRQNLYQLSYQGRPFSYEKMLIKQEWIK